MKKGKIIMENGVLVSVDISPSLISKFIVNGNQVEYCAYQIYKTYMTGDYSFESTKVMKHGIYFETKILGKNVRGEEVEPELTKSGKPTAEQQRIDEQVQMALEVLTKRNVTISNDNVQVKGRKQLIMPELDFNVFLTQTADLISPFLYRDTMYEQAVIDLKLSGNLNSTWGDYAWGSFEYMDKTQAYVASYVHNLPFFYVVFDYPATGMSHRIFKVNTLEEHRGLSHDNPLYNEVATRHLEMKEAARKSATIIDYHNEIGWATNPNPTLCTTCPLSDICEDSSKYEVEY